MPLKKWIYAWVLLLILLPQIGHSNSCENFFHGIQNYFLEKEQKRWVVKTSNGTYDIYFIENQEEDVTKRLPYLIIGRDGKTYANVSTDRIQFQKWLQFFGSYLTYFIVYIKPYSRESKNLKPESQ